MPDFPVPPNHTTDSYLEELVMQGLKRKYGEENITPELKERVKYELGIIEKWDFQHTS